MYRNSIMNHFETDLEQFKTLFSYVTRVFKWSYFLPLVMIAWQSNVVQAAHTNLTIMAVGDSITEGTKGESSYRQSLNNLLVNANCDFDWVGSQTQVHGHNNGNVYTQPHEGYSGHRADDILNGSSRNAHTHTGIADMLNQNAPGVVLLHIGSNDIAAGQTAANALGDIEDIVAIVAADPERLVFVANVIPWYVDSNNNGVNDNEWADVNALTNAINASNQSTASGKLGSYPNVILVDMRDPLYDFDYTDMHVDFNGDYEGIHPASSGEDKIAQAFFDAMKSVDACEPPSTTIASPAAGSTTPATVTFNGSAIDAGINGIAKVRIAIRENATGDWYDFDGQQFESPPPVNESDANLTNTSVNYTDWSRTVTLADGDYTFLALAVDNSGNEDYSGAGLWPVQRQFQVSSVSDSNPPVVAIDPPPSELSPTISGTATDTGGAGFNSDAVRVSIKNRVTGLWYDFSNNSFGPRKSTLASLSNTTNSQTDWSVNTNLGAGDYTVIARAVDAQGNFLTNAAGNAAWTGVQFSVSP